MRRIHGVPGSGAYAGIRGRFAPLVAMSLRSAEGGATIEANDGGRCRAAGQAAGVERPMRARQISTKTGMKEMTITPTITSPKLSFTTG